MLDIGIEGCQEEGAGAVELRVRFLAVADEEPQLDGQRAIARGRSAARLGIETPREGEGLRLRL